MASAPIGCNETGIERTLSTKSTAILVPFCTQELFMPAPAIYYGLNALSNNMIMADRKRLRTPNGVILGTPGSGKSFSATCQEPQHRAFMTSVLRYQRQMQRQGTLSFLPEPIMQDVRLHTLVFTVETVRWCIVVIQFSTHPSIPLTGRAISTALED